MSQLAEVLGEIWRRAISVQPAPEPSVVAGIALVALALVLVPTTWQVTRMLVTIVHEGGHGVAAALAGRRLQGIRLHTDTSGLTVSSGRASGPGMVLMLLAGYLAPAVVGLGAAGLLLAGRSLGLLWLLVLLLAVLLVQIRNLYGFAVVGVCGAALGLASWFLAPPVQSLIAYLITWIFLISAPKPVIELIRQRSRGQASHSDADQLARLTRIPGAFWTALFLIANLAGLVLGICLLLPALLSRFAPGQT